MSPLIILLILMAVALGGFGVHVLSLHIHRRPLDVRRPGPVVFAKRSKPKKAHSAELRRLVAVISNAILNDKSAQAELHGVFDRLGAPAPPFSDTTGGRKDSQQRYRQIRRAVADIESDGVG